MFNFRNQLKSILNIQCFLHFSLDVEGSEFQILKSLPFQEVDIKVIDVEVNHIGEVFPGSWEDILNYLETQGYEFHIKIAHQGISFLDAVFVKKGFLEELNGKPGKKRNSKKSKSTNSKYHVHDTSVFQHSESDCDSLK